MNRTSTMESSPSENGTRLKLGPVKRKHKSNRPTFDQRFVPSSPPAEALLPNCDELETYDPDERNLMFAQREPTLPDMAFVGGRLLIAAWDEGLDGSVNDPAASRLACARATVTASTATHATSAEQDPSLRSKRLRGPSGADSLVSALCS